MMLKLCSSRRLIVVDLTMLYVAWLSFHRKCHPPVVIIVSRFIVGH